MYKLFRCIFFLFPAETVHYLLMNKLRLLCSVPPLRYFLSGLFSPKQKSLQCEYWKLSFSNPVGLGAGFDKNASYLRELETLGFGFVEIGTVTPQLQLGNDKPRVFRLTKDKALINRMGFNNDGVKIIAERIRKFREKYPGSKLVIGGNIGKNKNTPNVDAWKDYEICFEKLFDCVDYFVVNVSSPNTPGLRELQEKPALQKILSHVQTLNQRHATPKPLLLKIAPDLTNEQLDDILDLAKTIPLDGIVAVNTTTARDGLNTNAEMVQAIGAGGLSGAPLKKRSTEVVEYIFKQTGGKLPIIASGGVFCAQDAKEKFTAGASLVQVWTGLVYEGPCIIKKICRNL